MSINPFGKKTNTYNQTRPSIEKKQHEETLDAALENPKAFSQQFWETLAKKDVSFCEKIIETYNKNPKKFDIEKPSAFSANMSKIYDEHVFNKKGFLERAKKSIDKGMESVKEVIRPKRP